VKEIKKDPKFSLGKYIMDRFREGVEGITGYELFGISPEEEKKLKEEEKRKIEEARKIVEEERKKAVLELEPIIKLRGNIKNIFNLSKAQQEESKKFYDAQSQKFKNELIQDISQLMGIPPKKEDVEEFKKQAQKTAEQIMSKTPISLLKKMADGSLDVLDFLNRVIYPQEEERRNQLEDYYEAIKQIREGGPPIKMEPRKPSNIEITNLNPSQYYKELRKIQPYIFNYEYLMNATDEELKNYIVDLNSIGAPPPPNNPQEETNFNQYMKMKYILDNIDDLRKKNLNQKILTHFQRVSSDKAFKALETLPYKMQGKGMRKHLKSKKVNSSKYISL
jgi:nitrogen regulatory protein PII-like uncharacterized protein